MKESKKVHNIKHIYYNFPIYDSFTNSNKTNLPDTFFISKFNIPTKLNNLSNTINSTNKKEYILFFDSGSYCNFISKNLVDKLKIKTRNTINSIKIHGISGSTLIKEFAFLYFQFKVYINNKPYLVIFKEKFLVTSKIPTELLIGNKFLCKYHLHHDYDKNFIYSSLNYYKFKNLLPIPNCLHSCCNDGQKFLNSNKYKNTYHKNSINNTISSVNPSTKTALKNNSFYSKNTYTSRKFYLNNKSKKSHNDYYPKSFKNFGFISRKIYRKFLLNTAHNAKIFSKKNLPCVTQKFSKNLHKKFHHKSKNFSKFRSRNFNFNYFIHSFLSNYDDDNYSDDEEEEDEDFKIEDIPEEYRDLASVFSKVKADKLPPHRLTDCKIVLQKDATLHYGPIYPLSEEESQVLKEYIDENLKKGFIRPSESPAGYPVLFQKKKDGSLRLCVDYKKLNAVTIRNSYPLPLISDIIERVRGAKFFTKLDLRSAYNLIRIREGDEYKTAFRTKYGHFEYLVMPFGLRNAPATFQSFINSILRPYLEKFVILYLDDILIFSDSLENHINHVRTILKTLLDNNLYAKLKKCEFHQPKVEFLGHVLSGQGISTDPKKIKSVEEWPTPTCVKDVQRFIGLCNFYRRFVENFATIAKPLHNLTKKNSKFIWDEKCNDSFLKLKKSLTSSPTLLYPDPTKPFIVECDASSYAIGAILSQRDDENRLHPVAYYSRSLNNAELNYSITEKELLAIKSAFSTWRHLLLGAKHQITVFTDHKNLLYTLGGKVGNQRQHRWHLFFQAYNFQLIYRQGRKNGKPDSLSRRPDYEKNIEEPLPENILDSKNVPIVPSFVGIVGSLINQIIENYEGDETADDIKLYFSPNNANQGYFYKPFRKMEKFEIKNKIILYNNLVYVPEKMRLDILTRYHDKPTAGHLGIRRTEELITRNFWWPKLHQDVVSFVNSCELCQRNKVSRHKRYDLLRPLEIPDRPWKSIEIDFLCGLPESKKFTVIMVVVDRFSKMIHLIPFKEIPSAEESAKAFLKNIFKLHGLPVDIYTDRGSQFTSALWIEIMEKLRVKPRIATTDHHETVGQVERCNSFIEQYLRCYSRTFFHDDWSEWLHLAEFVYNNTVHESTKQTPFFINYGFHPPMDEVFLFQGSDSNFRYVEDVGKNFLLVKDALLRSQDLYKRAADKKRIIAPNLEEGQKVWIHAPPVFITNENQKLAPRKYGPYKVLEVLANGNYKIDISNSPFPKHHPIFHISELEPYVPTPYKFKNRNKYKETNAEIVEISDFRTNYKEKRYEYRIRYKHRLNWHWVPATVIESDPRYQDLLIEFNRSIRKHKKSN